MGIELAQGRFMDAQDVNAKAHNTVVNKAFVRRYFGDGTALGRLVRVPMLRRAPMNLADDSFVIVGIVADTVNQVGTAEIAPEIFLPHTVINRSDRIFIRGAGRAESLDKAVKTAIWAVDPVQPVMEDKSLETVLAEDAYAQPRFNLLLFTVFATLGLALALFGVYGVISHSVAQQTREIGIRIALGAGPRQVVGAAVSSGARLVAIGIAVGLGASLASVQVLSGLVRNVSTFDVYSFVGVTVILLAAGTFASYWPARRAARVDPLEALRNE
jgi:hypothetical protein